MSVNKFIGIGHLGRDPETRSFPNGGQVANVSMACTEKWRDKQSGEQREHVEWINLTFNGRLAEIAAQYLRKGSLIYVEGRLRTRKWQGKDGQDRYTTEIRVDQMQMLGGKPAGTGADPAPYQANPKSQASAPAAGDPFGDMDSDIPFN